MRGLHESDIVRFPWLYLVKMTRIKSGFNLGLGESVSHVSSLCKNISDCLKHDSRKCWYKEIEDSNKCLFHRNFKTANRQEKYLLFCLMSMF